MTNSEAIKQLKERYDIGQKEYLNFAPQYIESLKLAMESLEENDKLKAEIEQLKSELERSIKLQNVLSKLLKGSEFARCYMCDNSMKNITLDGKNNGCDGSCYHANKYTEKDLLDKIKRELDRTKGKAEE